ncbi:hypothetical protein [Streptomyces longisporus]|uniref:Secreted protein n=1 Tax=Streptomyces longisporus TaxID=1948 RepID=A0ABP6AT94_STRLO
MKMQLTRRAATILAAAALTAGTAVAVTPSTAFASSSDQGIRLSTGHNVGVYGSDTNINNGTKVAADLIYANHDGIETDCYTVLGADLLGTGSRDAKIWYHTISEYYNTLGQTEHVYAWTYGAYVDGDYAADHGGLQNCNY